MVCVWTPLSPLLIVDYDWETFVDIIYHSCLPALSLIFGGLGAWVLSMRAMMISVQGEDYITYAKAKGLKSSRIFLWYWHSPNYAFCIYWYFM